ncbi:MAG: R3H domain-containing nucleic acid-binding protein [Patescibacteria group bacterium]
MSETNNQKLSSDEVINTVKRLVGFMNIDCQVEAKSQASGQGEESVLVSIQTPENAKFLIGRNGQNLRALEHVLRAILTKNTNNTVILDVNDYRKSRAVYLVDVAKQAVTRVRNTQKAEALFPMSAYERRIVHMELAACPDIATESIGSEPQRRIIIKPYP